MSEGDIKQVTVALSHPDELNPRKRRRTRRCKETEEASLQSGGADEFNDVSSQAVVVQKEVPTVTVSSVPNAQPVSSTTPIQTVTPIQPTPVVAATAVVGGGSVGPKAVHIREKKNAAETHGPGRSGTVPGAPKIVPHKKRLTTAPMAQTIKKPKLIIGGVNPEKNTPVTSTITDEWGTTGGGVKEDERGPSRPKHRRKFTERKIKIEVKAASKTRKSRSFIKDRINSMPLQGVRKLLIQKGLLKPKTTVPPEPMMRSMLRDYYMLKETD